MHQMKAKGVDSFSCEVGCLRTPHLKAWNAFVANSL